jgi:hypothetical protein
MVKLRMPRHGTCHRCGWKGMVGKVGWRDRRRAASPIPFAFGWLCDECADEVIGGKSHLGSSGERREGLMFVRHDDPRPPGTRSISGPTLKAVSSAHKAW